MLAVFILLFAGLQSVLSTTVTNDTWVQSFGPQSWSDIASDSTGKFCYAVSTSGVFHSTEFGTLWSQITNAPAQINWLAVATDSTGRYLTASGLYSSGLSSGIHTYDSSNGNWALSITTDNQAFIDIAMSADGVFVYAITSSSSGGIWRSNDRGETFPDTYFLQINNLLCVATSADGKYIALGTNQNGVYLSSDSGGLFIKNLGVPVSSSYTSISISKGNSKYIAATAGDLNYISKDSGSTWETIPTSYIFNSVAMSSDGEKMVASAGGKGIFMSSDNGTTWANSPTSAQVSWLKVNSDSTGNNLIATSGSYLYYYITTTTAPDDPPSVGATRRLRREGGV